MFLCVGLFEGDMVTRFEQKVLDIARVVFAGMEFTASEMFEELKSKWKFKISKKKVFHALRGMMDEGLIRGRKEYLDEWAWSGTPYRWLWKV
jgi:transcription initiation factor IIE alpha subunit